MKAALHDGSLRALLVAANSIDWTPDPQSPPLGEKKSYDSPWDAIGWSKDHIKSVAFQLCQTYSLLCGIELYTKADMAAHFRSMEPLLYRRDLEPEQIARRIRQLTEALVAPFLSSQPLVLIVDRVFKKSTAVTSAQKSVSVSFATDAAVGTESTFSTELMTSLDAQQQHDAIRKTCLECHGTILTLHAGIERTLYIMAVQPETFHEIKNSGASLVAVYSRNLHLTAEERLYDVVDLIKGTFDTDACRALERALPNKLKLLDMDNFYYAFQVDGEGHISVQYARRRLTGDVIQGVEVSMNC
jgi:hypothetical protein